MSPQEFLHQINQFIWPFEGQPPLNLLLEEDFKIGFNVMQIALGLYLMYSDLAPAEQFNDLLKFSSDWRDLQNALFLFMGSPFYEDVWLGKNVNVVLTNADIAKSDIKLKFNKALFKNYPLPKQDDGSFNGILEYINKDSTTQKSITKLVEKNIPLPDDILQLIKEVVVNYATDQQPNIGDDLFKEAASYLKSGPYADDMAGWINLYSYLTFDDENGWTDFLQYLLDIDSFPSGTTKQGLSNTNLLTKILDTTQVSALQSTRDSVRNEYNNYVERRNALTAFMQRAGVVSGSHYSFSIQGMI